MEDDYSHHVKGLIYVLENVPAPTDNSEEHVRLYENFNSQLTDNCNCKDLCLPSACSCYNRCRINYNFDNNIKLNPDKMKDGVIYPILECNDFCSCSMDCHNRLVQKGPLKCLYVKTCSRSKGYGLFSSLLIPKYSFVCEYAGEVLTKCQAAARHQYNIDNEKMNYVFCLNEHSNDTILQTFVDPSKCGNIGRYANHSCDPNCVIIPVRVNTPIPKLALFSCTDILPHTEITFNYGSNFAENLLPKNGKRTKCLCDTAKCTGWMPYQMY